MVNVLIVGHSQTPRINSYGDVNITCIKRPSACIEDLEGIDRLYDQWDIVILFIGGNDLCFNEPRTVADDIINLVGNLNCSMKVYVTLVETRWYDEERARKYNITTEEYNDRARACSNLLTRHARRTKQFRTIRCPPSYNNNSPEGIHFDEVAKASLFSKYKNAIPRASDNN